MGPFAEFENAAGNAKYPFSDESSLTGTGGAVLPTGFMLDASVCLWCSGCPELSSLSGGLGVFSVDGKAVAKFRYTGPGAFPVIGSETGKCMGLVVLGSIASGHEEYVFGSGAARLCPACFCLLPENKFVKSVSCDFNGERLRGNVRVFGENGVYVTKQGRDVFRVDIIGEPAVEEPCCSSPIQKVAVLGFDCPIVGGVPVIVDGSIPVDDYDPHEVEAAAGGSVAFVAGVIALHSPLSAEAVCGSSQLYVNANGTIGEDYCLPKPKPDVEPCIYDFGPFFIAPSNGNIDFVPYAAPDEVSSPLYVKTVKAGVSAASIVSSYENPSLKNLASAANSGTVVLGFKGRS